MRALWIAVTVAVLAATGTAAPSAALPGYGSAESESERRSESLFIDIPSAQSALETVTVVAARPHAAGSRGDYALAIWLRDRLRAAGLNAELQPFGATVDTPRTLRLELAPPDDEAPPANPRHRRRAPAFPVVLDLADRDRLIAVAARGERRDRLRRAPIFIGTRQIGQQIARALDSELDQFARELGADARERRQLVGAARRNNSAPTSSSDTPRSASSTSVW